MIDFHNMTSMLTLLMGVMVALAYGPLFNSAPRPVAARLIWGVTVGGAGALLRTNYWSNFRLILGDDWPAFREAVGGLNINVGTDLMMIAGMYLLLSARHKAIPEPERHNYNVFTAIWYPDPFWFSIGVKRGRK